MSGRRTLLALSLAAAPETRWLADPADRVSLAALQAGSNLAAPLQQLAGASVLVATLAQRPAMLAAMLLDGVARRILLCPPDLSPAHLPGLVRDAEVQAVVSDGSLPALTEAAGLPVVACCGTPLHRADAASRDVETEWVMFTSGTTGAPKLVLHTLGSLTGPLDDGLAVPSGAVWSTFYDVRRYGGLQILLRALLGGGSMVLSSAGEPVAEFLRRAAAGGVTHMSGTPSHWRRALMSGAAGAMAPGYVRLSGEVADQAILDQLQQAYPAAQVAHAFASTEAGVAFDVRDGLAGFPAALIEAGNGPAQMRVVDGSLQIRSSRTAARYLGERARSLREADAFVDTGDMVERRGERYYFAGRREGVINVGGQKVFPEEVEAVINAHPAVRMARVWARPSPITGAVVAAEVVLWSDAAEGFAAVREDILAACRRVLPAHKVPASLRQVASLDVAASGKLVRARA